MSTRDIIVVTIGIVLLVITFSAFFRAMKDAPNNHISPKGKE